MHSYHPFNEGFLFIIVLNYNKLCNYNNNNSIFESSINKK